MSENMFYPQDAGSPERDDRSIASVVRENQVKLLKYVRRRIVNRQDAEDVAAQVVCDFLESCRRRPEVRHFVPLLFTIAHSRVADYFKVEIRRHRQDISLDVQAAPQVATPRSMSHEIEVREELREAMAVMDLLREEDQEIITLSAVVGLSAEEIATVVGTSSGAVRVRLHFARKKFKRLLIQRQHEHAMDQPKH